jgi:hypothetical protein
MHLAQKVLGTNFLPDLDNLQRIPANRISVSDYDVSHRSDLIDVGPALKRSVNNVWLRLSGPD